jgi:hypothetical protein
MDISMMETKQKCHGKRRRALSVRSLLTESHDFEYKMYFLSTKEKVAAESDRPQEMIEIREYLRVSGIEINGYCNKSN